ncbi:MAG: hypothetical protein KDA86_28465, partial [Planctomycetaceae bacterium]|nr:hypothetical protein [Planctomycetaceae bacterium]
VDRDGNIKFVNEGALSLFGCTREEFMAERILFTAAEAGTEIRIPRKGSEVLGEMRVMEFEWEGERAQMVTIRDITRQRDMEMQLLTADRLVSLGTLAAGVAHEINNPLAAVIGNLGMALQDLEQWQEGSNDTEFPAALREMLSETADAAERIRLIVRDLKLFSRHEDDVKK